MIKRLVLGAIRFYQRCISPGLPPRCRFIPTCSQYALQAVDEVLRCHPFYKGDFYDPVP